MKNNKKNIIHTEYTSNRFESLDNTKLKSSASLLAVSAGLNHTLQATDSKLKGGERGWLRAQESLAKEWNTRASQNKTLEKVKNDEIVNANKNILPMFITPVVLKKTDDIKKNKLPLEMVNPEKRLTYKNISLIQILKKKLQKIENYSYNLKNNFSFHSNIGFFTLTGSFR